MPAEVKQTIIDAQALLNMIASGLITQETVERAAELAVLLDDALFFHG